MCYRGILDGARSSMAELRSVAAVARVRSPSGTPMIESIVHIFTSFLGVHGTPVVFVLGLFEEFFFFIPSTGFFIAAGFFIINPHASGWAAVVTAFGNIAFPISLGVVLGGWVMYRIVYWGGKPLIDSWGRFIRVRWSDIERLHRWFEGNRFHEAALLVLRVIPTFPIGITSIFAGLIRVGWWEFTWTTFLGTIVRVFGMSLLGWYLGKEYWKYATQIAAIERYIFVVLLIIVATALWQWYRVHSRRNS